MILWRLFLTPWAVRRVKIQVGQDTWIGYTSYYLFGVLVANIQSTKPWELLP